MFRIQNISMNKKIIEIPIINPFSYPTDSKKNTKYETNEENGYPLKATKKPPNFDFVEVVVVPDASLKSSIFFTLPSIANAINACPNSCIAVLMMLNHFPITGMRGKTSASPANK